MDSEIRWQQRLENYAKALNVLKEGLDSDRELTDLEKEGIIQRFEFTFELAWKTLKDYLQYAGVVIEPPVAPRTVIKQAFAAKIIKDGHLWIEMLEQRNTLSHQYDEEKFERAFADISEKYFFELDRTYNWLKQKAQE